MGAAASTIPMQIDKETFRRLSGGTLNDAIFDANSTQGIMTRDRLLELAQMKDCFLSHDFGNDAHGRNIHQRVQRISQALRSRGLLTHFDEALPAGDVASHITTGINRSRSLVIFLTKGYMDKVVGNFPSDHCHIEFNYTLAKRHPDLIVPVVMEQQLLNPQAWLGNIGLALGHMQPVNFVDDNNFDAKITDLYNRVIKISKTGANLFAPELQHNSMLSKMNKSKEEQQFFQWLARSTNIDESKRMIYCASLVKSGVSNVFSLAKFMNAQPNFLLQIGVSEYDADQIALAVRDLGLGYVPVRDFQSALTIESVVFALRKSASAPEDSSLAESALACCARVAASNKIMPKIMSDAGICEAILKLMHKHLAHAPSMEHGCVAIYNMAANNPEISAKFGSLTACDVLPRTIKCHVENYHIVFYGAAAIAALAMDPNNRKIFTNTGACDYVMKGVEKCISSAEVIEKCFQAANALADKHAENVGRLGVAQACELSLQVLQTHSKDAAVIVQVFRLMQLLAAEPGHRVILGGNTNATQVIAQAFQSVYQQSPDPVIHGCFAVAAIILGNSHNRNMMCQVGLCQIITQGILQHSQSLDVIFAGAKVIFQLAAGNTQQYKQQFQPIFSLFQSVYQHPQVPDAVKREVKEAVLKLQN
jgi:hypothetical protein